MQKMGFLPPVHGKKVLSFLLIFLFASLYGCDQTNPSPNATDTPVLSYTDTNSGVAFEYPDYWEVKDNTAQGQKQLMISTPSQNCLFLIQATQSPDGTPMFTDLTDAQISEYTKTFWNQYKSSFVGQFSVDDEPVITYVSIDNRKFISYKINGTLLENSTDYIFCFSFGLYEGKIYCFAYIMESGPAHALQGKVDAIIESIDLNLPEASSTPVATGSKTYNNAVYGVSLQYPASWKVIEQTAPDDSPVFIVMRTDGYLFFDLNIVHDSLNIKPYDQSNEQELEEEIKSAGPAMLSSLSNTMNIDGDPVTAFANINGKKFVTASFEATVKQTGDKVHVVAYSGFYYGCYYIFFTMNGDYSDTMNAELLEDLVNSFTILPPQ
jgi:hypothetical protein